MPAKHPLWMIIRLVVMFFGLMGVLWVNATKFDATELKTLLAFVILSSGAEGLSHYFGRPRSTDKESEGSKVGSLDEEF